MATGSMPGNNSLDRFVTACKMVNELKTSGTKLPLDEYAFSILDKVAQGDYTKWSIFYDISNKSVYFKTADFKSVKTFSFSAFDFACSAPSKMFDMNQPGLGDITASFILPDKKVKRVALEKAIKESSQYVTLTEADKKLLMEFEESVICDGKKD